MTTRFSLLQIAALTVLAAACVPPAFTFAQGDNTVFQMPERTLLQHLTRAKRAIEEERFSDAVIELGTLLNSPTLAASPDAPGQAQDYFVGPVDETGARRSLKGEAQRLLGSMPERGRELYELQYGSDARNLLDRAVDKQSLEDLNEVIRRYFHTKAGYEAMVLLGRLQLDRGRPLAAALCFKRVLAAPSAAAQYDPHLSVLLGACWVYANMPEQAVETMQELKQRYPRLEIELDTGHREALPAGEVAVAWLTKHFGPIPRAGRLDASQWLVHRGNLQRNATASGGMPLTQMRWRTRTTTDPGDEKLVAELQKNFQSAGLPAIPSVSPLAVDDVVLMRTPERLLAVDFHTGKRVWEYPWWNSSFQSSAPSNRSGSRSVEVSTRKMQLRQRLWLDAAYGLLSSDGQAVYLLDDLQYTQATSNQPQFFPGRVFRSPNPNYPRSHNLLVALDVEREGSLRWKVGGEDGVDEPKLAGAFFMGPPLPLLGQLYVIAEVNRELRLVVLDALTGQQAWTQQIAHVADEPARVRNRQRRLAGATPSFGNGVLVCPTSAGGVVALDVTTRALLWGYAYPTAQSETNGFGLNPYAGTVQNPGEDWADATATIAEGVVLLTPVESDHLFCLDLLTGVPKWEPKERADELADMQFIACVHQGKAILVGKDRLLAIRLQDGITVWTRPLSDDRPAMPSGRGFQTGDSYFLPTTDAELLEVDLATGQIAQRVKCPQPLGNLMCYDDQVISQGVDQVTAFYQIQPLRELVAARLAKSADDAWALARQGELLVHDGQPQAALDVLRKAHELDPRDDAVRSLLVTSFLELLRSDFAAHADLAPAIDAQIQLPHLRLEFLRLMAAGMEERGDLSGAAEKYLQLAQMQIRNFDPNGALAPVSVVAEPGRTIRLDRWVQARLAHLYQEADQELKARLDAAIGDGGGGEFELRQRINYFGFHRQADQARLRLIPKLASTDRVLEADLLLARLEKNLDRAETGPVVAALAGGLLEYDEPALAALYFRRLGQEWADVDCGDGRTGGQRFAAAAEHEALRGRLAPLTQWPYGEARADETRDRRGRQANQSDLLIPFRQRARTADQQYAIHYNGGTGSLVLRDGRAQEWLHLALGDGTSYNEQLFGSNYAKVYGQLLHVVLGDQLVTLDLSREPQNAAAVLWKARLSLPPQEIGLARPNAKPWKNLNPLDPDSPTTYSLTDSAGNLVGTLGPVSESGVIYLESSTLTCADPLTGEPIWQLDGIEPGTQLFGDDALTFAVAAEGDEARVLDSRTGRTLGKRPLPDRQHRWATHGRYVLGWEQFAAAGEKAAAPADDGAGESPGREVRLFLFDPWAGQDVWSHRCSAGARGTLIDQDEVAILEPDGRLVIRYLGGADVVLRQQVMPEPDLTAIYVLRSAERYLLVTDSEGAEADPENSVQRWRELDASLRAPMIFGHVHAFDRRSGEPLWQTPATIENFAMPLVQPGEVPTLWFLRRGTSPRSLKSPAPSEYVSLLCLDRRNGRQLLASEGVGVTGPTAYDVQADLENHSVTMVINGSQFIVQFTDAPVAPEPPVQTGSAASLQEDDGGLWNVGGALMKALIRNQ